MNEDRLLRDLARLAREEREADPLDERWDRLASGELSAEEEAELRALAETSEEARLAYEAFRPLGPEFEARVTTALRKQAEAEEAGRRVLPFSPRSGWLGGSLAAAAAACLVIALSLPPRLPSYSLEVFAGDQGNRGYSTAPGTATDLQPGSALAVTLRPQTGVSGRIEARWYVVRGGEVHALSSPAEISPEGAVRLRGTVGEDLAIGPGDWALWVVVARPGRLPDPKVLAAHPGARALHQNGWVTQDRWIALRDPVPLRVAAGR